MAVERGLRNFQTLAYLINRVEGGGLRLHLFRARCISSHYQAFLKPFSSRISTTLAATMAANSSAMLKSFLISGAKLQPVLTLGWGPFLIRCSLFSPTWNLGRQAGWSFQIRLQNYSRLRNCIGGLFRFIEVLFPPTGFLAIEPVSRPKTGCKGSAFCKNKLGEESPV